MSEQAVPERDPQRRTDDVRADAVAAEDTAEEDVIVGDDPGSRTGQVLGQSVPIPTDAAVAGPGDPETGAVRDEEGRPTTEKPYTGKPST
ncbi:hypothetical protein HC031_25215 [Planosporangium thailandense]|uniref:Uncharacterized protein n=1 Tax=Planosporangium thailandense TaxID=765197 RepID=A0ABX0Y3M6_9ACTN|nr:hypothetical protein [Planosporangium thailandense]NJC72991.1 hypothetical protein [Planosporangium thailandense]